MSKVITLSHGNGGRHMRSLIADTFTRHLDNDLLDMNSDAALLPPLDAPLMTTVDGFTVKPLFFPGGDIGSLAIHGTVNDLAVSGGVAKYITLAAILEEGLPLADLDVIVASMAAAAQLCGVKVVCGDTKVVPAGQGSGVYFTTTGIGYRASRANYSLTTIQPGDRIITSGSIGDHGAAVLLAREEFGLSGNLHSDSASVLPTCEAIYDLEGVRFMRDPTRGGLASVMHEVCEATGLGMQLSEAAIPVRDEVRTLCGILGYEAYYMANEGCVVAVVSPATVEQVLSAWPGSAAVIGEVTARHDTVVLETALGGERLLAELADEPLPRIC